MPLKVRSGNRPADTAADSTMMKELPDWNRTRTALLELEGRLRCSVCLSLLKGPVCLGGCEHVFCRTCVDGSVGNECPVCHTPAWVKDAQINRQLDNMIQLCSQLHNLLDKGKNNGNKVDLCQHASLKQNTDEGESKKKQIKMWFSPRRGKVRYVLEREENAQQIPSNCEQAPLLSTYEFVSSSPTVEHVKKKTVKRRKTKKKQLEDINQKWGIGTPSENTDIFKVNNQESNRSVSFCSPPHVLQTPDDEVQESNYECNELIANSPEKMELGLENHREINTTEINTLKENDIPKSAESVTSVLLSPGAGQETDYSFEPMQENGQNESQLEETVEDRHSREKLLQCTPLTNDSSGKTKRGRTPLKRKPYPTPSPISSATKCHKKQKLADDSKSEDDTGIGKVRNNEVRKSPKAEPNPKPHSTPRRKSQPGTNLQTSPSHFPFTKKNHKGETMLQVASIKGDVQAVEELLKSGANPNVKDNAGWTPLVLDSSLRILVPWADSFPCFIHVGFGTFIVAHTVHEACNHGHTNVVEALLRHQALVNTTGYQNDTPLHDAVKNGHIAIVRLLLQHGALQDAVIMRPDKVEKLFRNGLMNMTKVLDVLEKQVQSMLAPPHNLQELTDMLLMSGRQIPRDPFRSLVKSPVDYAETEEIKSALLQTWTEKQLHSPGPVPKVARCREGSLVILASGLPASQRTDLNKLVSSLKAEICTNYNSSGVKACLETKRREPEELHEVDCGPHRARLNREQLLPSLLDGCHFYFLGCFKEHRKEDLIELVKAAGAQILIRQPKPDSDVTQTINTVAYHADADSDQRFCTQYIIYDNSSKFIPGKVRQGKVWFAPSSWLIECISSFHLLPVPQT